MAIEASGWFNFGGAALELVLGAWVYGAAPRSGVNRGFALFLVATALGDAAQGVAPVSGNLTRVQQALFDAGSAAYMMACIGLAWLALAYPGEGRMSRQGRIAFVVIAALCVAGLLSGVLAPNDGWLDRADDVLQSAILAGQGLAAAWIARHVGQGDVRRQESTRLIVLGLSFWPLWVATLNLVALSRIGPHPFNVALPVRWAFALGSVALWGVWRLARRDAQGRVRWGQLVLLGLSVALGVLAEFVPAAGRPTYLGTILAMVLFVAYGILRYDLFTMDHKVRFAIKTSTVAAVFLAVLFIVGNIAQNFLGGQYGVVVGGAATGLLFFAIAPIQRAAEKLSEKAVPVPSPAPSGRGASRAEESYLDVLRRYLRDGVLSRDEERVLAHLAGELRIDAGHAFELRQAVEAEAR